MFLSVLKDNREEIWPKQPYQPEFGAINYRVEKSHNATLSLSFISFSFMSAGNMNAYYYKCSDGVYIKKGVYHDALEDCAKSHASIQTYLEQVSTQNR